MTWTKTFIGFSRVGVILKKLHTFANSKRKEQHTLVNTWWQRLRINLHRKDRKTLQNDSINWQRPYLLLFQHYNILWKEAACSYISTFFSSFYVIPLECGCQINQKYIPLYEHYKDKNNKNLVQMSCTAYIVYTFHISSHRNFGQFKAKQVLIKKLFLLIILFLEGVFSDVYFSFLQGVGTVNLSVAARRHTLPKLNFFKDSWVLDFPICVLGPWIPSILDIGPMSYLALYSLCALCFGPGLPNIKYILILGPGFTLHSLCAPYLSPGLPSIKNILILGPGFTLHSLCALCLSPGFTSPSLCALCLGSGLPSMKYILILGSGFTLHSLCAPY